MWEIGDELCALRRDVYLVHQVVLAAIEVEWHRGLGLCKIRAVKHVVAAHEPSLLDVPSLFGIRDGCSFIQICSLPDRSSTWTA